MQQVLGGLILGWAVLVLVMAAWVQSEPDAMEPLAVKTGIDDPVFGTHGERVR